MRNLVLKLSAAGCALTLASACAAQSVESGPSPDFSARQLVEPAEFVIEGATATDRLEIRMSGAGSWVAILGSGGRVWTATEADCPAFAAALRAFRDLPPLTPGPYDLRDNPRPRPLGPRSLHAQVWTLQLAGFAPDHTSVDMEISGSQGPYSRWATETAAAIRSCDHEAP